MLASLSKKSNKKFNYSYFILKKFWSFLWKLESRTPLSFPRTLCLRKQVTGIQAKYNDLNRFINIIYLFFFIFNNKTSLTSLIAKLKENTLKLYQAFSFYYKLLLNYIKLCIHFQNLAQLPIFLLIAALYIAPS